MNSRKSLIRRQDQACFASLCSKDFAARGFACTLASVKLRWIGVPFQQAAFRNPSPWRQSGAKLHLLPLFFLQAASTINFEREIKCRKSQSLAPRSSCPSLLQGACPNQTSKFKALPQVLQLARLQVKQLAEAIQTLQPALFLARSLALQPQPTNNHIARHFAASSIMRERRFAPLGRAAFCVAT